MTGMRSWDVKRNLFYPHDVEEVLKLHVPSFGEEDFVECHCKKSVFFFLFRVPTFLPKVQK